MMNEPGVCKAIDFVNTYFRSHTIKSQLCVFALVSGGAAPVFVLSLDLVDRNVQRVVGPRAHGQGLVDAELRRRHRLPLWEGFEVEAELLPVRTWLEQAPLVLL